MPKQNLPYLEWLQRNITDAHIYFQQMQAYTHQAFLQTLANGHQQQPVNLLDSNSPIQTFVQADAVLSDQLTQVNPLNPVNKAEANQTESKKIQSNVSTLDPELRPAIQPFIHSHPADSVVTQATGNTAISSSDSAMSAQRAILKALYTPAFNHNFLKSLPIPGIIAVVNGPTKIARALASFINQAGCANEIITEISQLEQTYATQSLVAVIDLSGLEKVNARKEAISKNHLAFATAQALLPKMDRQNGLYFTVQDTGGDFALSLLKDERRAWLAGIAGLTKTISAEYSQLTTKAMDIECHGLTAEQIANKIFNELIAGGPHAEVGYKANGERITLALIGDDLADEVSIDIDTASSLLKKMLFRASTHPSPAVTNWEAGELTHHDTHQLRKNGRPVIVVSGGARGVTAGCIIALAQQLPAHYVLLGRTPLHQNDEEDFEFQQAYSAAELQALILKKSQQHQQTLNPKQVKQKLNAILAQREIKATIAAIQAADATVDYVATDIQDEAAVREALATVRQRYPRIIGLIHGAGVLADKLIVDKTAEQFDAVFNTKINGLQTLLAATEQDSLQFICLFSSVSARFGNRGQSDYAMANEILNKVAQQLAWKNNHSDAGDAQRNCLVKSINWGPWDSGMVTPSLKKLFANQGIELLPYHLGVKAFVTELCDRPQHLHSPAVEVIIGSGLNIPRQLKLTTSLKPYHYSITVNAARYPDLTDHRIQGVVVVPACQVLEWFIEAAQAIDTEMAYFACLDLKVLHGITLPKFDEISDTFTIAVEPELQQEQLHLRMFLMDQHGKRRYTATVVKSKTPLNLSIKPLLSLEALEAWKWPLSEIYQESLLFHGPAFQAIIELNSIGNNGASAVFQLRPETQVCTPLITLDACLQLCRLWTIQHLNKRSLPTKIAYYQPFVFDWPEQVRCVINSEVKSAHHSVHTAYIHSLEGKLIAIMGGMEAFYLVDHT